VIACWPVKKTSRALIWTISLLLLAMLITGCDLDGYPDDLRYPPRMDPLAIEKPKEDASDYDRPGEFPNVLFAGLPEKQRKDILRDPSELAPTGELIFTDEQRATLDQELAQMFGTPANPTAELGNSELVRLLKLDAETLKHGSALYRQQCLHCHGLSGDGRGATAPWVNPHPRDYRQGIFKFTSSGQDEGSRKPRKYDLLRTLREGVEGTSMPSFRLLPDEDLEALASYVIHLSMRGEIEFQVIKAILTGTMEGKLERSIKEDYVPLVIGNWQNAQNSMIKPPTYPAEDMKAEEEREKYLKASIERGFGMFNRAQPEGGKKSAGCLGCHTDFGRRSAYKYDAWGTVVKPADLTIGMYRGGRRPVDLYWRVHSGINGVTMPASSSNLSPDEVWDIVNFLRVLPYPKMREKYGIKLEQPR